MSQDIAQYEASRSTPGGHASRADMAELSSYLAAMAIVVGLILAWVCISGI